MQAWDLNSVSGTTCPECNLAALLFMIRDNITKVYNLWGATTMCVTQASIATKCVLTPDHHNNNEEKIEGTKEKFSFKRRKTNDHLPLLSAPNFRIALCIF